MLIHNFSTRRFHLTRALLFVLCVGTLLFPAAGFSASQRLGDNAGVNDHPHNLSSLGSAGIRAAAGTEERICVFCHTPHSSSADGPLWNRNDPIGPNGDGTFPLYGRPDDIEIDTIPEAQYGTGQYPNGSSRLCLSCHDGVTAIGEVINPGRGSLPLGSLGSIEDENPGSNAVIDMARTHPISFVYNETVRAAIITQKVSSIPTIVDSDYSLPAAGILDGQNRMQCTSCHDPHLDTNDGVYTLPMWKKYSGVENTDYEDTCNECHDGGSTSGGLNQTPNIGGNHNL